MLNSEGRRLREHWKEKLSLAMKRSTVIWRVDWETDFTMVASTSCEGAFFSNVLGMLIHTIHSTLRRVPKIKIELKITLLP